jgi:hypothetical protein
MGDPIDSPPPIETRVLCNIGFQIGKHPIPIRGFVDDDDVETAQQVPALTKPKRRAPLLRNVAKYIGNGTDVANVDV